MHVYKCLPAMHSLCLQDAGILFVAAAGNAAASARGAVGLLAATPQLSIHWWQAHLRI
jgi:hypothetical protein